MTPPASLHNTDQDDLVLLDRILAERRVRSVYQPLVHLDTGNVVAYEALARGPEGSALERPDLLFAAARRARRVTDLDVACRVAAVRGAREARLSSPYRLFVNVEPEALEGWRPEMVAAATGDVPVTVIVELTERALAARPAELLQTVARIRELGWGVALDDVGAVPASLALLPMLRPDVIKLDLRLVQDQPTAAIASVINAVHAEAERSGTVVLAEGLETAEHVQIARAFGATLGQGWYFGRPAPLPRPVPAFRGTPVRIVPRGDQVPELSPFQLAARSRNPRAATKPLLIEVSKQLEAQARHAGETAVVLAAFQHVRFFTEDTRRRYEELARHTAFVGALGEGMPSAPLRGVRGAVLDPTDPLIGEWDIAVLGPHFAATLVARDFGDTGPDRERRFEFVLSHDRDLTIAVAHSLMSRVWPEPRTADLPAIPGPAPITIPVMRRAAGTPAPATTSTATASTSTAAAAAAAASTAPPVVLPPHLLRRAVDAATTGITIADVRAPDEPLVWANPAFLELSGYPLDEVIGRNCRFLQGPETDPVAVAEMSAAIAQGRELRTRLRNYRIDGTPWWNEVHLCPVRDASGEVTHYIGVQNDITARVEAEQKVLHLAYHDQLTGLPNRARLAEELPVALERGARHGTSTALLFIDLDDFKGINDAYGHSVGDMVLKHVAGRLRATLRADDLLVRQGGDEFLVLLTDLPRSSTAGITRSVAEQLLAVLAEPVRVGDVSVPVRASVGISSDIVEADSDRLLGRADGAMYSAKRAGGHRFHTA